MALAPASLSCYLPGCLQGVRQFLPCRVRRPGPRALGVAFGELDNCASQGVVFEVGFDSLDQTVAVLYPGDNRSLKLQ